MGSKLNIPQRGEVWEVNLDPTVGSEIKKTRPCLVISSDSMGSLPIKIIAPITGWDQKFVSNLWHIKLEPDANNNLDKTCAIDVLQIRALDYQRFTKLIGRVSPQIIEEAVIALAAVVEYQ